MNKRNFVFLLAALLVVLVSAPSIAASKANSAAGESVDVGTKILTFNFSPGVFGKYITATDTDSQQWYAIATVHTGGKTAYATASNFASLYTSEVGANTPVTADNLNTVLTGIPEKEASASEWGDWTKK